MLRELVLRGKIAEGVAEAGPGGSPDLRAWIDRIDRVRTTPGYTGLFVRFGELDLGWARAIDLANALGRVRRAGKPVHCHFETADTVTYRVLAEGCSTISMTPAGDLDLVGIAADVVYAHRLLERLGVTADMLHVGRYKGAADSLMLDEMPAETRETLDAILDDTFADLLAALVAGRRLPLDRARALVDEGPFDAEQARAAGLIDRVAFDDEARAVARREARAERIARDRSAAPPSGLFDLLQQITAEGEPEHIDDPHLALVYLAGAIVQGEDRAPLGASTVAGGPFVREMRKLADDHSVRAIVLRIDSPGGSALASDLMWHAVRRAAGRKPVIATIGDMGASGGYYVASAATRIVARPTSLVGSIGVVGGKVAIDRLAARYGVTFATLRRGRRAAWSSIAQPFNADERETFLASMRRTYERFVSRVRVARHLPDARVRAAAEGRLWTGTRGLSAGLVDELGGLREAIARARGLGHLAHDSRIEEWPLRPTLAEALAAMMGSDPEERATRASLEALRARPEVPEELMTPTACALLLPMMLGEHTTASLPFVLRIR